MADALRCDGPGCGKADTEPYLQWWSLEHSALARLGYTIAGNFERTRLDFCSWQCLGAFVLDKSGDVAELERRIADL